jgi:uncharacterized phage-associated protein
MKFMLDNYRKNVVVYPAMKLAFDIQKAIAAAGYLCQKNGGSLDMLKLIKMLYIADRKALVRWHRPITGDDFYSLDHGPIVSRIYDLIKSQAGGDDAEAWGAVFNPRQNNTVSLKAEPDFDSLSKREVEVLDEAFAEFIGLSAGEIIETLHRKCPEWLDPKGSRLPILPEAILREEKFSAKQISEIEEELATYQSAKMLLRVA